MHTHTRPGPTRAVACDVSDPSGGRYSDYEDPAFGGVGAGGWGKPPVDDAPPLRGGAGGSPAPETTDL